jgi:hypothetical protein
VNKFFRSYFVAVEGLEAADTCRDARGADQLAGGDILQDEEVVLTARFFYFCLERPMRLIDAVLNESFVSRQGREAARDQPREFDQGSEIFVPNWTEYEHGNRKSGRGRRRRFSSE